MQWRHIGGIHRWITLKHRFFRDGMVCVGEGHIEERGPSSIEDPLEGFDIQLIYFSNLLFPDSSISALG